MKHAYPDLALRKRIENERLRREAAKQLNTTLREMFEAVDADERAYYYGRAEKPS